MKITLEPTDEVVILDGVPVRVWIGVDERGRPYDVFVHRIGAASWEAQQALAESLAVVPPPYDIATPARPRPAGDRGVSPN